MAVPSTLVMPAEQEQRDAQPCVGRDSTNERRAIDRVPPEVWRKIFLTVYFTSPYKVETSAAVSYPRDEAIEAIMRTCRLWREVALDTSYLWHVITYDDQEPWDTTCPNTLVSYFRNCFERARSQELAVSIKWGFKVSVHGWHPIPFPHILLPVMQHLSKIRCLHISVEEDDEHTQRLFDCNPIHLLSRDRPWSGLPTGSLVSLQLTGLDLFPLDHVRTLLKECAQLRKLYLWQNTVENPHFLSFRSGDIPLPKLTDLHLTSGLAIRLLTGSMVVPALTSLTLTTPLAPAPTWLILPAFDLPASLKRLTLVNFEGRDIRATLAAYEGFMSVPPHEIVRRELSLSHLAIYRGDFRDSIAEQLFCISINRPLFPHLKRLKIVGGPLSHSTALKLLDFRMGSSHPRLETLDLELYGC